MKNSKTGLFKPIFRLFDWPRFSGSKYINNRVNVLSFNFNYSRIGRSGYYLPSLKIEDEIMLWLMEKTFLMNQLIMI